MNVFYSVGAISGVPYPFVSEPAGPAVVGTVPTKANEVNPSQSKERSTSTESDLTAYTDLPRDMVSSFRVGGRKSRNGCVTCKIRRVKCDETRPLCNRCVSTGRNCDGYSPPKEPKSKKSKRLRAVEPGPGTQAAASSATGLTSYVPSLDIQASMPERRSFHYFQCRNLSSMPGNFEPYFWDKLVLQFSHAHPTMQQSLVALSAIYEEHESNTSITIGSRKEFVLRQYNKAVRLLVEYLSSDEQDAKVALISCLMFVWIEFLQNNVDSGIQHLNSGINILKQLRQSKIIALSSVGTDRDSEDVYGSLNRSFTRLRIQAAMHGSTKDGITTSSTRFMEDAGRIPRSFRDIFESRICLDNEINAIWGYMRTLRDVDKLSNYAEMGASTIDSIRRAHLQRLEQWKRANDTMVASLPELQDGSQSVRLLYLELYYIMVMVGLKTLLGTEMAYDEFILDFERILTICETLIYDNRHEKPLPLSFETGVIPPLMFLILKCRLRAFRQRAIHLLRHAPQQEGMWFRDSILKICMWKVALEEAGRGELPLNALLPESARIYQEHIVKRRGLTVLEYRRGTRPGELQIMALTADMEVVEAMGNML